MQRAFVGAYMYLSKRSFLQQADSLQQSVWIHLSWESFSPCQSVLCSQRQLCLKLTPFYAVFFVPAWIDRLQNRRALVESAILISLSSLSVSATLMLFPKQVMTQYHCERRSDRAWVDGTRWHRLIQVSSKSTLVPLWWRRCTPG